MMERGLRASTDEGGLGSREGTGMDSVMASGTL
jgi:hypothetical protein